MAKSSPEKLAQALRANLKRRKGPVAESGPEDGRSAKCAPENGPAQAPTQSPKTSG
jgi:hypothetical protein